MEKQISNINRLLIAEHIIDASLECLFGNTSYTIQRFGKLLIFIKKSFGFNSIIETEVFISDVLSDWLFKEGNVKNLQSIIPDRLQASIENRKALYLHGASAVKLAIGWANKDENIGSKQLKIEEA